MKTKPVILKDMDGGTLRVTSRGLVEISHLTTVPWNASFKAIRKAAKATSDGEALNCLALEIQAKSQYDGHILRAAVCFGREADYYRVGCRQVTPTMSRRILKLAGVKPKSIKAVK